MVSVVRFHNDFFGTSTVMLRGGMTRDKLTASSLKLARAKLEEAVSVHETERTSSLVVQAVLSIPNAGNASSSYTRSVSSVEEQLLYTEKVGSSTLSRTTTVVLVEIPLTLDKS